MTKQPRFCAAALILGLLLSGPASAQTAETTETTLGDKVEIGVEATKDGVVKVWDGTKYVSKKAWEGTKKGTAKAIEKSGEAWEATKSGTAKAVDVTTETAGKVWDKTKEVTGDVVDAVKTPNAPDAPPVEDKSVN